MRDVFNPHDLLWLDQVSAIEGLPPGWPQREWHPGLPVVVRRDKDAMGRIPVGIRGNRREDRFAGWVKPEHVVDVKTPEDLTTREKLEHAACLSQPVIQAALHLCRINWPWQWGITGSAAYSLATGQQVLHAASDLDVRIHCLLRPDPEVLLRWYQMQEQVPCRIDTQLEVAGGAFSLADWMKGRPVLLKTPTGPRLTADPWHEETNHENTVYFSRTGRAASRHVADASIQQPRTG